MLEDRRRAEKHSVPPLPPLDPWNPLASGAKVGCPELEQAVLKVERKHGIPSVATSGSVCMPFVSLLRIQKHTLASSSKTFIW